MASRDGSTAILISDLTVTYGPITALDAVSLAIPAGQVIGLVGHNGAGKSTLVNAITGAVRPTSGGIRIDGRAVDHAHTGDPLSMARHGMRVIHQEPSLAGVLSIADNITLHAQGDRRPRRERVRIAREALAAVGSTLDPERMVSTLGFGDRQIVDLARALLGDVKALLLDEPTAALGREETDRLHALLSRLAAQGKAIVYVSHRLRDIVEVCDRIVVLREGRVVMDRMNDSITAAELSEAVSPDVARASAGVRGSAPAGATALRVKWKGSSYAVRRGEIVGLFGMAGGPQFSFARALYGLGAPSGTTVELEGRRLHLGSPREAMRQGICYVSADRERESLFHLMSALSNLCVPGRTGSARWASSRAGGCAKSTARPATCSTSSARPWTARSSPSAAGTGRSTCWADGWAAPAGPGSWCSASPTRGSISARAPKLPVRSWRPRRRGSRCWRLVRGRRDLAPRRPCLGVRDGSLGRGPQGTRLRTRAHGNAPPGVRKRTG